MRRLLRPRRAAVRQLTAVGVTALLALGVMAPYLRDGIYQNGDLWNFLGGVVEARNALGEHQFPIRVAPQQLDAHRYPVFQFYANLPYTLAGLILGQEGRNPYAAWKWTMSAALMVGGLSVHRLAWRWTRSQSAALAAVAVFLSAPYLLTDLNDRGAVSEAFAICLLPAALLSTWTCMVRPQAWRIAGCAVAWTALGLTHNITYLYGATFIGLLILSFVRPRRRFLPRFGRLAAAGLLHLMLLAWYVVPQFALMPDLAISTGLGSPAASASLVPLKVLLWPVCRTPDESTIPRLGLQVGWLVLASALAAVAMLILQRRPVAAPADDLRPVGRAVFLRGLTLRLLVLWAIALFVVWSPFDFWARVPKLFYFVQFTYRVLAFVLLPGALLCAVAVARISRQRVIKAGRRLTSVPRGWVACGFVVAAAGLTQFAYYPPGLYHPRGAHRWINDRPQLGGLGDYLVRPQEEPPLPPSMVRVRADRPKLSDNMPLMAPFFTVDARQETRAVLPVLWYPGMLSVTVNGREADYGVSGRDVTVDLPPGQHVIGVRFVGVRWANHLSLAGVMLATVVVGSSIGPTVRRKSRRK